MENVISNKQARVCFVDEEYSSYEGMQDLNKKLEDLKCKDVEFHGPGPSGRNKEMYYHKGVGAISGVDSSNKKSRGHLSCFSLSAFGDSSTDGGISMLAHFTEYALRTIDDQFMEPEFVGELILRLRELKTKSDKGNLQICAMGSYKDNHVYKRNIEKLKEIAKKELGIDLQILDEKYEERMVKDVYVENDSRRIYQISSWTHYR